MTKPIPYRVLADYEVHEPHPLKLEAGQPVKLLRRDLSWPGWVWVQAEGQTGWLPENFLEDAGSGESLVSRFFDGSELSARRGEILEALDEATGWIYARRENGEIGWFPLFNLKPVPNA